MTDNLTTTVFSSLAELINERFEIPLEEITPEASLEALSVDSLALIELTLLLNKQFGVAINATDVTPENTVGELAAMVATQDRRG